MDAHEAIQSGLPIHPDWVGPKLSAVDLRELEVALTESYRLTFLQTESDLTQDGSLLNTSVHSNDSHAYSGTQRDTSENSLIGQGADLSSPEELGPTSDSSSNITERRRAQNRSAQRAYRQRQDQFLRNQQQQIRMLKMLLTKEQKLSEALRKTIEFLEECLSTKPFLEEEKDSCRPNARASS